MGWDTRAYAIALFVLGCFLLRTGLLADPAQVAAARTPIKISSKEADDNLVTKGLRPEYPPEAKAKGIEGTVRLRVIIDENGSVVDAKVVSGNPILTAPAIVLVKRFLYRTFTRRGKRVSVTTDVVVPFELHPDDPLKDWTAHRDAAKVMRKDGRIDAAVGELQKALIDARKLGDGAVAVTYGDMADLYQREGRLEDASSALGARLRLLRDNGVQDETEIANTESDLANTFFLQRKLDKAEELLKTAIPVQDRYFQQANFEGTKQAYAGKLALSVEMLARIYDLTGRVSEAVPLYERAVTLGKDVLHPDVEAVFMRNYADVLQRIGRPEEAAKQRRDATALQLGLKR